MRHAAGPRVELGTRTIFNLLGPLANPARVRRQLIGVFAPEWARPMAETLGRLGSETAWIVHGQGLDELTVAGENQVTAWQHGAVRSFTVNPEDIGLPRAPVEAIRGGDAALNAATLLALLQGATGPYRDTVLLNAAAALNVAGKARRTCARAWRSPPARSHPARHSAHWKRCGAKRLCADPPARSDKPAGTTRRSDPEEREEPMADDITIPPADVLARICADTLAAVARAKAATSIDTLRYEIGIRHDAPRGFGSALKHAVAGGRYGLIAEIKKASPSGGLIRPDFDPAGTGARLSRRRGDLPLGADRRAAFPGQCRRSDGGPRSR